jgi:hypothetical protein
MSELVPIVLATQSDRLLDALQTPEESTVVCTLDPRDRSTRLARLDAVKLERWKEDYAGPGSMRADGLLDLLTADTPAE